MLVNLKGHYKSCKQCPKSISRLNLLVDQVSCPHDLQFRRFTQKFTLPRMSLFMTSQLLRLMDWFKVKKIEYLKIGICFFPWNEKILKLCLRDYIFRSCYFLAEVTSKMVLKIH